MKLKPLSAFVGGVSMMAIASLSGQANGALLINEIFVAGGTSNAAVLYKKDFIELFNTGPAAVDLSGYSLDYASGSGTFGSNRFTFASGATIAANDYLLITTGTAGTAGADLAADVTTTALSLSAASGKVRLVDSTVLANSANVSGAGIQDFVGYGAASLFEGAGAAPQSQTATAFTTSISRNASHTDTNNNSVDFAAGTPTPTRASVVPEPTALSLIGLGSLATLRRRRA